jgi:hypothetical protein
VAILVILVLVILWGAVLLPPILRSRADSGAPSGIADFVGKLRLGLGHSHGHDAGLPPLQPIMGPVGGREPAPGGPMRTPGGMSPVQKRRRDVLIGLLTAVGITFVIAFMAGSMIFWGLWILSALALGGYVFMLLQLKAKTQQRRYAARQPALPTAARPALPAPALVPSNVHQLDPTRHRDPVSHVGVPREATVLALRRNIG